MNEAQQHGGALRAIEHVPLPSGPGHHPNVHVEKDSFDGFCVTWNAAPGLRPSCELQFRCNFLSTDFSRSKGVKGIPVRLCAKSEEVGFSSDRNPSSNTPEICYCKIKLFRDHGAERKLSNDEAAVRRAIKKIEDQLKESGAEENVEEPISFGSSNKRRAGDISPENKRPNKLARKARAASTSSEGSSQGHVVGEGDASQKLASLNRFLRSRLEITSFSLQGLAADDPDLHPVTLKDSELKATRDSSPELQRVSRTETGMTEQSAASSALTSTFSVSSPQLRKPTYLQVPTPMISQNNSEEWQSACKEEQNADRSTPNIQANNASPQDERKHSTRISFGDGKSFQVLDVDPTYRPPPLPVSRPGMSVKPYFFHMS